MFAKDSSAREAGRLPGKTTTFLEWSRRVSKPTTAGEVAGKKAPAVDEAEEEEARRL